MKKFTVSPDDTTLSTHWTLYPVDKIVVGDFIKRRNKIWRVHSIEHVSGGSRCRLKMSDPVLAEDPIRVTYPSNTQVRWLKGKDRVEGRKV